MRRLLIALIVYFITMLIFLLLYGWLGIDVIHFRIEGKIDLSPLLITLIVGGLVVLKYTTSSKTFYLFLIIYLSLWAIRFALLFIGQHFGPVQVGHGKFDLASILYNYLVFIFKLEKPFPFIVCWLIDYAFVSGKTRSLADNTE